MRRRSRRPARPEPNRAKPGEEVLDLKSAAAFLRISKPTFYRWLAQGKIKGFKAGQQWRFYRADLEKFLEAEEPSALQVDAKSLGEAVDAARRKRGLPVVGEWPSEEGAVIMAVNLIIQDAIAGTASDIHIDHNRDETLIRYRIDGLLTEAMRLPRKPALALVARLKVLADMNLSERRLPQNGRIHVRVKGQEFDLRVTTMPTVFGEAAVTRILDPNIGLIGLDVLGFSQPVLRAFEARLRGATGLIVVSGPSGSGRTTTLYSALNQVRSLEKKVVTIEDPVEYFMPDIMQTHVNRKAGLTMASGVRAFMRCDPDIILVGDLRDLETAEMAIAAAMTGHLVLTAMLPLDAASVVTGLVDMGLEPFLVSSALVAVLAQRLVRKICPACTTAYEPPPHVVQRLHAETDLDISRARFQRGEGCAECRHTGYRGRTALFELLEVDDRLRELIARPAGTAELHAAAVDRGMTTMLKDGVEKAMQGVTTVEEVLRVLAGLQKGEAPAPSR